MNRFLPSRKPLASLALAAMAALPVLAAQAAEWQPERPVTMIVPSTAGAGADITARLFSDRLATALGQPVIVDNRGGAGGLIGTNHAANSAPDGYTLVLGSDYAFTIYPQLRQPPFDPINDFAPVGLVANLPMLLVVNQEKVPAQDAAELIDHAKKNPGKLTVASAGIGSSHHLAAEYFKHQAGVDILHVPYKGAAEAMTDVLGGRADMMFISPATALPHIKSGRIKALGVSVPERIPVLPDVPPLAETVLPGFDVGIWFGFLYPARTPQGVIDRVNAELQKILAMPEVRNRIVELGYSPAGGPPSALAQRLADDTAKYRKLVSDAQIKLD